MCPTAPHSPGSQQPLAALVTPNHPLVKLAHALDWPEIEQAFATAADTGRPALPTRLLVGLHYLKAMYHESDESVVEKWVETVVAEEVGELAARSAAATREIEEIVTTIQRETSQVVEAMEQSTSQVVEGTHLVEEAKESLSQILMVSRHIDDLVQSISSTTVSQAETSTAVSHLMRQIAEVSAQTSTSSRQVSQAIRQTVMVAQDLEASVGTFEVGED